MSVHQAFLAPDSHNSKLSSVASNLREGPSPYVRFFQPVLYEKQKKTHCVWCKVHLTLLSSAQICKSRVEKTRKNEQNRPEFDLFRPFSGLFRHLATSPYHRPIRRALSGLCSRRHLLRTRSWSLRRWPFVLAFGYWLLVRGLLLRSWLGLAATPSLFQPASSKKLRRGRCR